MYICIYLIDYRYKIQYTFYIFIYLYIYTRYFPISTGDVVRFTEGGCEPSHNVFYLNNESQKPATVKAMYSLDGSKSE